MAVPVPIGSSVVGRGRGADSRSVVQGLSAKEIIFAVVGPVGSGTSKIGVVLKSILDKGGYKTEICKARDILEEWDGGKTPGNGNETSRLQDIGDEMRSESCDNAAVALRMIRQIRFLRAKELGLQLTPNEPVEPDDQPRAYILDSLRHPAEVILLRSVYQEIFCLVGVVCDDEDVRIKRLRVKHDKRLSDFDIETIMQRDEKADEKFGQQVADTFHLADFFVDNSMEESTSDGYNEKWNVKEALGRLVDILTHEKIVRPRPNETAMFHADGARMRSSCLSRQVGASLTDHQGNIIATGTNEVPRAGGGTYGGMLTEKEDNIPNKDHRCFFHGRQCRNNEEQIAIIYDMLNTIDEFAVFRNRDEIIRKIRKTRIGQIIEFSRSIHAEMDAILSASRLGFSTKGTKLYVTTFPCHNCARHIVAAGVDEVQFIEPYLKSRAIPLHGDVITTKRNGWKPPSLSLLNDRSDVKVKSPQVLFSPFVGVAPRFYRRAFYKDRDLKCNSSGALLPSFGPPEGMGDPPLLRVSYAQVEAKLASMMSEGDGNAKT